MVKIVAGWTGHIGDMSEPKVGSVVWAALITKPVGARVESWGITYEKATP